MPEWPKGAACKVAGVAYGGSNPPPPTTTNRTTQPHRTDPPDPGRSQTSRGRAWYGCGPRPSGCSRSADCWIAAAGAIVRCAEAHPCSGTTQQGAGTLGEGAAHLGVDLGGSKSHALIADETGQALGFGEAGAGNHEVVGEAGRIEALRTITTQALAEAGITKDQIAGSGFGIAGYDWPSGPG